MSADTPPARSAGEQVRDARSREATTGATAAGTEAGAGSPAGSSPASRSDGKNPLPKPGHLPMTELLFDKQGPASPFGEDIQFPLPPESLPYTHPGAEH